MSRLPLKVALKMPSDDADKRRPGRLPPRQEPPINLAGFNADTHPMGWQPRASRKSRTAVFCAIAIVGSCLAVLGPGPTPASALTSAAEVSAGGEATCAIMTDGNAYCWGDNTYGELGNGTTTSSAVPVLVSGGHTWASLSILSDATDNYATACGVTTSGAGYCWGSNNNGQVGDGTTALRDSPTLVSGGYTWSSISVSYDEACGVTTSHVGYCWGGAGPGDLGNQSYGPDVSAPSAIYGGLSWSAISVGSDFVCGVTTGNVGYCWGWNYFGQLGDANPGINEDTPAAIAGSHTWSSISAGAGDACGVTTGGSGYCWGGNNSGEDGNNSGDTEQSSPVAVVGGHTWALITEGNSTTCGVTTNGHG